PVSVTIRTAPSRNSGSNFRRFSAMTPNFPCSQALHATRGGTSRGFPRAVNDLCLQFLVATFAAAKSLVDEKAAQSAVTEVLD
ncbi:hypothetical protein ACWEQ3_14390, partial [Streptomyces mirabilis]